MVFAIGCFQDKTTDCAFPPRFKTMQASSVSASVLENPATSYWLRQALTSALARDPVDALNDAEQLVALLTQNLAQLQNKHPGSS